MTNTDYSNKYLPDIRIKRADMIRQINFDKELKELDNRLNFNIHNDPDDGIDGLHR